MKKTFLFVFALCATIFSLHAQFSVGVRGGVQFANVRQTDLLKEISPDLHDVIGASIAAVGEWELHPNFALQAELGYTRKGFGLNLGTDVNLFGVSLPLGVDAESRFDYLEMPLLAKAKLGSEAVKFYAMAGPAISYAGGARLVTKTTGIIEFDLTDTKLDLDVLGVERWDISAIGGIGAEFNTGFGKFFIDGRYTHGFQEIYDIPLVREKAHNRGFGISAGVAVRL